MKGLGRLLAPLAVLLLSGCVESSMVARARLELEHGLPGASFEREFAMRLGRISTALIRPVALWALYDDEDGGAELELVRRIRRVDLAVYEVTSFPETVELGALERRMRRRGWKRVVRVREEDEITWVFHRENGAGEIQDMFVVSVDGAEMVMVRVGGQIDRALAALIADDPGGFGASLGG